MLKPFVKYTLLVFLWKRYKRVILGGLLLLFFIVLTIIVHNDFMRYTQTVNQEASLALSFFLKWGLILGAICIYVIYIKHILSIKPSNKQDNTHSQNDAFSTIRKKDKLASKADKIIDFKK